MTVQDSIFSNFSTGSSEDREILKSISSLFYKFKYFGIRTNILPPSVLETHGQTDKKIIFENDITSISKHK